MKHALDMDTQEATGGVRPRSTMLEFMLKAIMENVVQNVPSRKAVGQLAEGSAFSPSNLEESLTMHAQHTSWAARHGVRPELMPTEYLASTPGIGENAAQNAL